MQTRPEPAALRTAGKAREPSAAHTPFALPTFPYAEDALAPVISARTVAFHHGKHHRTYVETLNKLVADTEFAGQPLEAVVKATAGSANNAAIFNNAAQAWNHAFYWPRRGAPGVLANLPPDRNVCRYERTDGSSAWRLGTGATLLKMIHRSEILA